MAKNKLEYLESKFSPEEAQSCRDKGDKNLFGDYVTQEEHDAFWEKEKPPTGNESLIGLGAILLIGGAAVRAIVGVTKFVQWLTNK